MMLQEPKSVFEVENTSEYSNRASAKRSIASGVHPGLCKSKAMSYMCAGSLVHKREKLER